MQSHCPALLETPALTEQVGRIEHAVSQLPEASNKVVIATIKQWLLSVCAASPYIARTLLQFPDVLPALIHSESLVAGDDGTAASSSLALLTQELDNDYHRERQSVPKAEAAAIEALEQGVLRQFRHRHMVRILWCDLTGLSTLEQTLMELSLLAQSCVVAADQWTYDAMLERYGMPVGDDGREQRLIIIGMGKLGGFELNVSSDIDLICIYPSSGETQATAEKQKVMDNGEFFRRSVQRVSKLLNSVTSDGFVYRVDTRLRPFGESGPLVMNFDGLENYYLTQARDWERYAMIKGRALCGNSEDIEELEALVTPFVYRRYLDYNAFESLRDLKRQIALSLLQKRMVDNIKLGSGGIREVEFIGQAFQLVRGGREGRLRIRPIMQVLQQLQELDLLSVKEVQELLSAYCYLRRVENGVQMMRDEQVHALPDNDEDKQRLLHILDEPDWSTFRQVLGEHQRNVSDCFSRLFEPADEEDEGGDSTRELNVARDLWAALSTDSVSDEERQALLHSEGFATDEYLLSLIGTLTRGSFYQRLTAESQQRVERLFPLIFTFAKDTDEPGPALGRILSLVKAVAGRSGYLQVLYEKPEALRHLVTLFSQSSWLADFVASQPMVIDEILTNARLQSDAESVFAETQELVDRLRGSELDVQMDSMRHYRQGREMRIACAQLDGSLTLMEVSDQLSWLAESIIAGVVALVRAPLIERYGAPGYTQNGERHKCHVAVLAYGKLGGLELGFSSDLDLVFVHDSQGAKQLTDGEKPVENALYYSRLAQKFVHFMGTNTPAGMLYEIDLRLRPNGSSGVLVTGIDTFADYQKSDAWTWEHQALMRARMVYGHDGVRSRFDEIRMSVLTQPRPEEELRLAVANMRQRMRDALGNRVPGQMHLKQDAGGVADIEFIVQFLVLAHASRHSELLHFTDNIRVLNVVEKLALLPEKDCQVLRNSYLDLRERLHRRALDNASVIVPVDAGLGTLCASVTALRKQILGEPSAPVKE